MRHDRLEPVAEQSEQIVDQPALSRAAGDQGFENVGMTDLPDAAESLFPLQSVDRSLDRGVGGAVPLREGFLNFTDCARLRASTEPP